MFATIIMIVFKWGGYIRPNPEGRIAFFPEGRITQYYLNNLTNLTYLENGAMFFTPNLAGAQVVAENSI